MGIFFLTKKLYKRAFLKELLTAPCGSREGENYNFRYKIRDEILREMIDQGYNLKLS